MVARFAAVGRSMVASLMMYARRAAVIVAMTGCTALLDLSATPNVDRDNDRVDDNLDNCPDAFNPDQSDYDENGIGDVCDACTDGGVDDIDRDGIPDACDGCIGTGVDKDEDGVDDGCDVCIETGKDVNADGIDDGCQLCPPTASDPDDDADGIANSCDSCFGPKHDEDLDGIADACDMCRAVIDPDQQNTDQGPADAVGDACDPDRGTIQYETFDSLSSNNPAWYIVGAGWTRSADDLNHDSYRPSFRFLGDVAVPAHVSTTLSFIGTRGNTEVRGGAVVVSGAYSTTNYVACELLETGVLQMRASGVIAATTMVQIAPTYQLSMVLEPTKVTCSANGVALEAPFSASSLGNALHPGLAVFQGTRRKRFAYFDSISAAK